MRLLHPKTIDYVMRADDKVFEKSHLTKKLIISHVWSETIKSIKSGKKHPKMDFLTTDEKYRYLIELFKWNKGKNIGVNLDETKLKVTKVCYPTLYDRGKFDNDYLFSDLVSLYFKGVNLFPMRFGDEWRKYVPIESLKEIKRQVDKTLGREK